MRAVAAAFVACLALPFAHANGSPTSLEDCEARVLRAPRTHESYECFWMVAGRLNLWHEAAVRLEARLALRPDDAWVRLALAEIQAARGVEGAATLFREAAGVFAASGEKAMEVRARLGLARQIRASGRAQDAESEVSRAGEIARASSDPALIAEVEIQHAWQTYGEARYGDAERVLRGVQDRALDPARADLAADWRAALGAALWGQHRFVEAREQYRTEADLRRLAGDSYSEAAALSNLTLLTAQAMGRPWTSEQLERVRALAERTRAAARAAGNRAIEGKSLTYLAQIMQPSPERRTVLRDAVEILHANTAYEPLLLALRLLAEDLARFEPRDPERAFRLFDEARDVARAHGSAENEARAAAARESVAWELGRLTGWRSGTREAALSASLAALDVIEGLRDRQADEVSRARVFSSWAFAYRRLIGQLLWPPDRPPAEEDVERAFAIAERMRARALLERLDSARISTNPTIESAESRRQVAARQEIQRVQRRLLNLTLSQDERAGLLHELERLEAEEELLRGEIERLDPRYRALVAPDLPSLGGIRHALSEDEVLLSFQLAERGKPDGAFSGGSWVFVVTRDAVRVEALAELHEIAPAVDMFVGLVARRDGAEAAAAVRLCELLFETILDDLPNATRHLILVPDGPLYRLPFAALRQSAVAPSLGARYAISITPSAATWLDARRQTRDARSDLVLAVADPDLTALGGTGPDAAPSVVAMRDWTLATGGVLEALPFARRESAAVRRSLGPSVRLLHGRGATERAVVAAARGSLHLLHLATHVMVDDRQPERSAVLLAAGGEDEDGLLQLREVAELDLDGAIVVLSGCRSASGTPVEAEGILGPARAFFLAGARAVIGGLWPLRDDEAMRLFEDFYRELGRGQSIGAALAAAQRARIEAGAPTEAWAGIVLIGDGSLVPFPEGRTDWSVPRWLLPLVAVIVSSLAGLAGVVSYRRAHRAA